MLNVQSSIQILPVSACSSANTHSYSLLFASVLSLLLALIIPSTVFANPEVMHRSKFDDRFEHASDLPIITVSTSSSGGSASTPQMVPKPEEECLTPRDLQIFDHYFSRCKHDAEIEYSRKISTDCHYDAETGNRSKAYAKMYSCLKITEAKRDADIAECSVKRSKARVPKHCGE